VCCFIHHTRQSRNQIGHKQYRPFKGEVAAIAADVESGRYKAKPSREFSLEDIEKGQCVLKSNEAKWKMVGVL
jgi:hypothetical protein